MNVLSTAMLLPRMLRATFRAQFASRAWPNFQSSYNGFSFPDAFFQHLSEEDVRAVKQEADEFLRHEFCLLGPSRLLGKTLPWHVDHHRNYTWSLHYFRMIRLFGAVGQADLKVPWELSRFQFLPLLVLADRVSDDPRYLKEVVDLLEDWLDKNPFEMGVNWKSPMDVALRGMQWAMIWPSLNRKEYAGLSARMAKSLYDHASFIISNLENEPGQINNHYLSNLVGLGVLAHFFNTASVPSVGKTSYIKSQAKVWWAFVTDEISEFLKHQVSHDGCAKENSLSYNAMVLELLLIHIQMARNNSAKIPDDVLKIVEKMSRTMADLLDSDGTFPEMGDADDGRILPIFPFLHWKRRRVDRLIALASLLFSWEEYQPTREGLFQLACTAGAFPLNTGTKRNQSSVNSFPDGGFHVLREGDFTLWFRCGCLPDGYSGGHAHNDQLSICLHVAGHPVLIDSGSGNYTADPSLRNQLRSTSFHNTLQIGDMEQNALDQGLFNLKDRCRSELLSIAKGKIQSRHSGFLGEHTGHARSLKLSAQGVSGVDEAYGVSGDDAVVHFILHPDWQIDERSLEMVSTAADFRLQFEVPDGVIPRVEEIEITLSYNRLCKTKRVTFPALSGRLVWALSRKEYHEIN